MDEHMHPTLPRQFMSADKASKQAVWPAMYMLINRAPLSIHCFKLYMPFRHHESALRACCELHDRGEGGVRQGMATSRVQDYKIDQRKAPIQKGLASLWNRAVTQLQQLACQWACKGSSCLAFVAHGPTLFSSKTFGNHCACLEGTCTPVLCKLQDAALHCILALHCLRGNQ